MVIKMIVLASLLLCASCSPGNGAAETLLSPDIVLDGTEVYELASFKLRPLDASAAGDYDAEQGGATQSVTLSLSGSVWQFVRSYQEPGEPLNRAVHELQLSSGLMMSSDGNVIVRGTEEGILVLERASDTIPADYWVHYRRSN